MGRRALRVCVTALLWLWIALLALVAAGNLLKDERGLAPWGVGFFVVQTGSMSPAIAPGSIVVVRRTPRAQLHAGQVVTFFAKDGRHVVTHRLMAVEEREDGALFVTKGDANDAQDDPIPYDDIIGRVVLVVPMLGYVPSLARGALVVGGLLMLAGGTLVWREVRRQKRRRAAEGGVTDA